MTVNLLQWLMCLLWGAQFTGIYFHSNQHLHINTAEYPQNSRKPVLRGNVQLLGANTFHYLGSHCSQNGAVKVTMHTRQIQKFALFRKQRALIILWRTLDNTFSIQMNLNRRMPGCFELFLPLLLLLVLCHRAPGLAGLLRSLYACHEAAFGPTRN